MKKRIAFALCFAASLAGVSTAAQADDDPVPPPPGCEYVMGKLICVDMPIEP